MGNRTVVGGGRGAARELGAAVREARKAAGISQAELGEFVGDMPRQKISDIEQGRLTRQAQRLLDLLDAVGLELELRPRSVRLARGGDPDESAGES